MRGGQGRPARTFDQPEGLLTAAVRRQPFAVVLLDEIEKAHPEVFDLLLQVLGEGRLTDALGRTVDFSNTLIVFTSNLGVREAQRTLGFHAGGHNREAYSEAARRFFRPEFFNRLDRVVPFDRLDREQVGRIARLLIQEVLQREGLVRRKCVLRLEEPALEWIIDQGFDPVMGARALKRGIERQLTQPVAARLAAGLPETITVIGAYLGGEGLRIDVAGLEEVEPLPEEHRRLGEPEAVVRGVLAALRRIEERFAHLRPKGEIVAANLQGEQVFYFVIQERVRRLLASARILLDELAESRRPSQFTTSLPSGGSRPRLKRKLTWGRRKLLGEMAAAADLTLYLEDQAREAVRLGEGELSGGLLALVEEAALLDVLADASARPAGEQVLLYLWTANPGGQRGVDVLASLYKHRGFVEAMSGDEDYGPGPTWWALERTWVELPEGQGGKAVLVRGLAAERLTAGEVGTHLFCMEHEGVVPVQVHAFAVSEGGDPLALIQEKRKERGEWLQRVGRGEATPDTDPLRLGKVVRLYNEKDWIDLRTGMVDEDLPSVPALVLAGLPLPAEVREGG